MTEDEVANDDFLPDAVLGIVYRRFMEWDVPVYGRGAVVHLANLLGYKTLGEMVRKYSPDDVRTLKLLDGEHGYTVYRVLLAKLEEAKQDQQATPTSDGNRVR